MRHGDLRGTRDDQMGLDTGRPQRLQRRQAIDGPGSSGDAHDHAFCGHSLDPVIPASPKSTARRRPYAAEHYQNRGRCALPNSGPETSGLKLSV
jgi:hypothetical protein